jgi:hypothetical protein
LIYAIGDGFTNPKSKWFGCHILTGDFDNNPDTMIDVVVLDSNNRLWIVNGWIVKLKMAPILRDRVARSSFPDPKLYNVFKGTEDWRKMGGFLKLSRAERDEYGGDLNLWAEVNREDHPGAFLPSLLQSIRKWMTSFSNQYKLHPQSGLEKKDWSEVINHAETAVATCLKQKYYRTVDITRNHYIFAINETFKIYHNGSFTGLVPNGVAYSPITRMIMTLKKKKEDADAKKAAGKLDEGGVAIMNYLKGFDDDNTKAYTKNVYEPYIRNKLVDTSKDGFIRPEFISTDFIKAQDVAALLKRKFQTNATVKKSHTDLNKMIDVATNVINKLVNPTQTLNTLAKSPANNKIITEMANISNSLSDEQIDDIKIENESKYLVPTDRYLDQNNAWQNNNY